MSLNTLRIVLDTNVVVRAFINPASDSGLLVRLCGQRRVVPLMSSAVLGEYRVVIGDPKLFHRYPQLQRPEVAIALQRLVYVSDMYRRMSVRFDFPRDPKDSHLIELAIAGAATHLVSTDHDLLALPHGRTDAARRFRQRLPKIEVQKPDDFIASNRSALGLY